MMWGSQIIEFTPPEAATFSHTPYCGDTNLDVILKEAFSMFGPEVLMLMALDQANLIIQLRDAVRRVPLKSIREVSVYPVLPAKACGHVQMHLELGKAGSSDYLEFFMCGPHSEAVQNWCMGKATQVATMLNVPVKLLEPGHDC